MMRVWLQYFVIEGSHNGKDWFPMGLNRFASPRYAVKAANEILHLNQSLKLVRVMERVEAKDNYFRFEKLPPGVEEERPAADESEASLEQVER